VEESGGRLGIVEHMHDAGAPHVETSRSDERIVAHHRRPAPLRSALGIDAVHQAGGLPPAGAGLS